MDPVNSGKKPGSATFRPKKTARHGLLADYIGQGGGRRSQESFPIEDRASHSLRWLRLENRFVGYRLRLTERDDI